MKKILNKTLIIVILAIILLNMFSNVIFAAVEIDISKVLLKKIGEADKHLKYYREDNKEYRYLICSIVGYYDKNGNFNPSYCMNKNLTGAEDTPYNVTVKSLLNNNKVWRVIKNGYPYKNAKELGLANDYNAYAVTKWAVYCMLGESDIDKYKAEKNDKEAVAMLKALKKLVKIGNSGTEKQQDDPLKIEKVGTLKEGTKYYSQELKVTSTADFKEYSIENTKNIPNGGFIADLKGNKKKKFKVGNNFKVMIPKSAMNKNINIQVEVSAQCECYVILEGRTTVTNTQNYVLTAGEISKSTKKINIKENVYTGKLQVNKVDSETKKPIQGVEFTLKNSAGKIVGTSTTDSNGVVNFNNLLQGEYTLKEIKTNKNYKIINTEFKVNIEYNKTTVKDIENEHEKGNLKIYKVDADNKNIGLENIEFELYNKELNKKIGKYITDSKGEIYIENLRTGNYIIKEISTNKWYNLVKDLEVEVKNTPLTEVTISNELKKGQVKVVKVDKENKNIKLSGVKFNVINDKENILETITTDSNGEAVTKKYPVRDYEKLYLQEIESQKDYKLNNEKIEVKLKENKTTQIQVENEIKKGKIKVIKVDKDNNEIKLQGVKFEVYDNKGKLIQKLVTDQNGEAITKDLPINKEYTIKEVETDKKYKLNNKEIKVEVKYNQVTDVFMQNEKKKGKIKVIKVDKDDNEIKLKGVEFNIINSKGEVVDNIKTDSEGEAETKKLPIDEKYKIVEIKTLENYVLTDKEQIVNIKENETTKVVIENQKIKGKLQIIKTSKDDNKITGEKMGTPLQRVQFDIYNSKGIKVETITTNKNGIAESKELEKGIYKVKEILTNEWYILNDKPLEFEIKENNELVRLDITNESKDPKVDIEKNGPNEAEVGTEIEYDISVRNTGNTPLDKFTWYDVLPAEYIKLTKFETGTYNQDLRYNLYYKTNLTEGKYVLLMEDLKTKENYKIDFSKELADNEYVTELRLEFGRVDVGFGSNENPHIIAKVNENLKNGQVFENVGKVSGIYNKHEVTDVSKWKTKVIKILPVTGE